MKSRVGRLPYFLAAAGAGLLVWQWLNWHPDSEMRVSPEFTAQAHDTFDAIQRCEEYHTKIGPAYETRLLDAEKALDSLRNRAGNSAENNRVVALGNYLTAVQIAHLDWEHPAVTSDADRERHEAELRSAEGTAMP